MVQFIPTWKGEVEVPASMTSPPATTLPSGPSYFPDLYPETITIEYETMCTGFFSGGSGLGATAAHCNDEEFGKQMLQQEAVRAISERRREQADAASAGMPAGPDSPSMFDPSLMNQELEVQNISFSAAVAQVHMADPCINGQRGVHIRMTRGHQAGGDYSIFKLDDAPDCLVYIDLESGSMEPGNGTTVWAAGFPGSHIQELNTFEPEDERSILDKLRESDVRMTVTEGQVSGEPILDDVAVTETDVSMDGGMSGGPVIGADLKAYGVISGGFPSQGGNFNFFTRGEQLYRDMVQQGAIYPTTAAQQANDAATPGPQVPLEVAILLVLAAIAVTGGLVTWFNRGRKPRPAEDSAS